MTDMRMNSRGLEILLFQGIMQSFCITLTRNLIPIESSSKMGFIYAKRKNS